MILKLARSDGKNNEFGKLRISLTYDEKWLFRLAVQANLFGIDSLFASPGGYKKWPIVHPVDNGNRESKPRSY